MQILIIAGPNGAGKSTIFKLLLGQLKPQSGNINIEQGTTIGIAEQMIPTDLLDLDLVSYFKLALPDKNHGIERDITRVFKDVGLDLP